MYIDALVLVLCLYLVTAVKDLREHKRETSSREVDEV